MMKALLILSSVLALGLSEVLELDNGQLIEVDFENKPPSKPVLPYPYNIKPNRPAVVQPAVMKPVPTPIPEQTILVPSTEAAVTEVAPSGFISNAVYTVLCAAKSGLSLLISKGPALIVGTVVALAVCKFTCLCDSQTSVYDAPAQIVSIATPERIARAAEFVTDAVKKYSEMQDK